MAHAVTAIIHVLPPAHYQSISPLEPTLQGVPGVDDVQLSPDHCSVTVNFDGDQTGLSDLVRTIEELGMAVSGIAQRRCPSPT